MNIKKILNDWMVNNWQMRVRYYIKRPGIYGKHEVSRKQWEAHGSLDVADKIRETAVLLHVMLPK